MAEILEDSRITEKELHVFVADLSKAFDSMEYWSQAMSWRALGMPEEIIKLLVNLDAGRGNGPWETGEQNTTKKGATTSGAQKSTRRINNNEWRAKKHP